MTELEQLRAEVERLRAEVEELKAEVLDERGAKLDARTSLAAANALLGAIRAECDEYERDMPVAAVRAHLAAQPATAPTRTEAEQRVLDAVADAVISVHTGQEPKLYPSEARNICYAELARRGLK